MSLESMVKKIYFEGDKSSEEGKDFVSYRIENDTIILYKNELVLNTLNTLIARTRLAGLSNRYGDNEIIDAFYDSFLNLRMEQGYSYHHLDFEEELEPEVTRFVNEYLTLASGSTKT